MAINKINYKGTEFNISDNRVYSSDEQVIGTYLGKPLYSKTFLFENVLAQTFDHGIENVDKIWFDFSACFVSDGDWTFQQCGWDNFDVVRYYFICNRSQLLLNGTNWGTPGNWDLTVNYTKTTDVEVVE
jgi:hypothetical protein